MSLEVKVPFEKNNSESEPHFCIFCEIVAGRSPVSKITENEYAMCIVSLEGHPLVIPRLHIENDFEAHLHEMAETFKLASSVINTTQSAFRASGVSIYAAVGASAGQEVPHFHIHLIPRLQGDKKIRFRQVETYERRELDAIASTVKRALKRAC